MFFLYFLTFNDRLIDPVTQNLRTDLYQIFRIGRWIEGLINLVYQFAIPQGNQFFDEKFAKFATNCYLSCWYSEMDCNIAVPISKDKMA